MLEADALRKVLYQEAINAAAAAGLTNCKIGDEPFVPPTDGTIFGEFWFRTGKTTQKELGAPTGYECTAGLIQFTLYTPEKVGDGPGLKMGGQLKHAFNRMQFAVAPSGWVTIDPVNVQQIPGIRNGHKVVVVDATFDFWHRNPSAT